MDENEFDIYDDLDVFDRNDKQQEQVIALLLVFAPKFLFTNNNSLNF